MKKRLLAVILALALTLSVIPAALAADDTHAEAARCLYELGLFQGVGTNADGTPDFALDRAPTRAEAVTMLVRLLGKEAEAKAGTWETPFTDVADWAKPYVGYAYANNLTTGTSATTFGGDITVNATQYLTMVLRALGYSDKWEDDFQWDAAWGKADKVGLTHGEYNADTTSFTRGDVAAISKSALTTIRVWGNHGIFYDLFETGMFTPEQVRASKLTVSPNMKEVYAPQYVKTNGTTYGIRYAGARYRPTLFQDEYTGKWFFDLQTFADLVRITSGEYKVTRADSAFLDGNINLSAAGDYKEEEIGRREVSLGEYVSDYKSEVLGKEIYWSWSRGEMYEARSEAMGIKGYPASSWWHGVYYVYSIDDLLDYFEITDPVIREKLANPKIEEIDGNNFLVID